MAVDMREKGCEALAHVPEAHLPVVVRWLELLAATGEDPDVEPEELWSLATGQPRKMVDVKDDAIPISDWSLTVEQMLFMTGHHNEIETAYEEDDLEYLRQLAASNEFLIAFGEMGFDEAYDRYESILESGDGT
jgi:hypothetical protein